MAARAQRRASSSTDLESLQPASKVAERVPGGAARGANARRVVRLQGEARAYTQRMPDVTVSTRVGPRMAASTGGHLQLVANFGDEQIKTGSATGEIRWGLSGTPVGRIPVKSSSSR